MSALSFLQNWNDIIRDVFFKDELLKTLMMIPEGTTIINFIDRYFIRAGYTSKTLKNLDVRIIYTSSVIGQQNLHITDNSMSFDIYVKYLHLHDANNDRLMFRTNLIAQRILELLTGLRYVHNYRFWIAGESDMGTSAIGYARYNITLNYMKIY